MRLVPYEKYKESGVEWLGVIPEHWEVKRNKSIFYEVAQFSETGEEVLLTVSHITGVTPRSEKNVNMFFAETMEGYKLCKIDDLIINTMWAWMGALGTSRYNGICSPAYNVYRKIKRIDYNAQFFDSLFKTPNFITEMTSLSKGIVESRLRLYPKDFFKILTPLPNLLEQTAIANYLDKKTATIDTKINLLTKKTEHYQALRRSLINETVCRGLDKSVMLKDSGIEWIGDVPEHWEFRRLKDLGIIETSSVNKKIEENEQLIKLVNYTDVYGNQRKEIWNNDEYMTVSANIKQIQDKKLRKGDVLFTPSSETIEDIGVSSVIMENLDNTLYSYHVLRLKFKESVFLDYKKYLFNNDLVQHYFSKSATGTTRKILGLNTFNNLPVFIPPTIEEQNLIAVYLNEKSQKIDTIITNIKKQIEKLKELRKTLINDVVTGKIKVS
jgi:type I restriction enzyme, S subunit